MKYLIDLNVFLDAVLDRRPFVDHARRFFDAAAAANVSLYVSAISVTTIFYLVEKQLGKKAAFDAVDLLLRTTSIAGVDGELLRAARAMPGPDFEDNVQIAGAAAAGVDAIVTRNLSDFRRSPVAAIAPAEAARSIGEARP